MVQGQVGAVQDVRQGTGNTQHVDDEAPRQAKARIRQRITQEAEAHVPHDGGGELRHNVRVNLMHRGGRDGHEEPQHGHEPGQAHLLLAGTAQGVGEDGEHQVHADERLQVPEGHTHGARRQQYSQNLLTLWQGSMGEPATREEVNLPPNQQGNQDFREALLVKGADALPLGEVEEGDAGGHEKEGDGGNRGTREDDLENPARRIVIHPVVEPVVQGDDADDGEDVNAVQVHLSPGLGAMRGGPASRAAAGLGILGGRGRHLRRCRQRGHRFAPIWVSVMRENPGVGA